MKEIIRIHIAKIAYESEPDAKKALEAYLRRIGNYADRDVLEDVEIRITELLAERGIASQGVITAEDVAAITAQLGDPKEFLEDGDIAVGSLPEHDGDKSRRRLYRDPSSAVLGGVLSGLARYLDTNPLWTRLVFLVLVFVSFGTAIIVYIAAWIIIPPVQTTADRLELEGKPVTLGSIREMSEKDESVQSTSPISRLLQNLVLYGCGAIVAVLTLGALAVTVFFGVLAPIGAAGSVPILSSIASSQLGSIAYALLVIGGLLTVVAGIFISYALFARRIARRSMITIATAIIGVVIAMTSGLGLIWYSDWQEQTKVIQSVTTKTVPLGDSFSTVEKLIVNTDDINDGWGDYTTMAVEYHAAEANARYDFTATPGPQPSVSLSDDKKVATLSFHAKDQRIYRYMQPTLHLYGPSLKEIVVQNGSVSYTNVSMQETMTIVAKGRSAAATLTGSYKHVSVSLDDYSSANFANAAIDTLSAVSLQHSSLEAGVVRMLEVTQPQSCASSQYDEKAVIRLSAVTSNTIRYNGVDRPAGSITNDCGNVILGRDKE